MAGCKRENHHDYFSSELFDRMPPITQDVLLRTSPFDAFDADTARSVVAGDGPAPYWTSYAAATCL